MGECYFHATFLKYLHTKLQFEEYSVWLVCVLLVCNIKRELLLGMTSFVVFLHLYHLKLQYIYKNCPAFD